MATVVLRRRAPTPASNLLERLLFNPARTFAPSSSAIRSFNANAQMTSESDSDERPSNLDRRYRRGREEYPSIFSDVFDPFNPTRSLSQVLNLMDQVMDLPASARGVGAAPRRGWDAREDAEGLYLRIDMPGLGKEHVKVSAENGTLIIRGEGEKEGESEESRRRYSSRIDLPDNAYKLDGIKAEMKNGVLKVTVPKVKEEEKKDVYQVQIE